MSVVNEQLTSSITSAGHTRRRMFTLLAVGLVGVEAAHPASSATTVADALAESFALKRRAYQTGDADLLRSFYAEDIVIVGEGRPPLLGLEQVIAAYKALLPRRRDIEVSVLRSGHSQDAQLAWQFVRFVSFAKDPAEKLPVVTFLFLWRQDRAGWRCIVESLLLQDLSLTPGVGIVPSSDHERGAV
jgi:ketosteroid isomerase-like protein